MEGRRIDVVRLAEVHMIVGIDELALAFVVTENFEGRVGDHLVDVHIGRRARASLDKVGDELIEHFAGDRPVAGADNRVASSHRVRRGPGSPSPRLS